MLQMTWEIDTCRLRSDRLCCRYFKIFTLSTQRTFTAYLLYSTQFTEPSHAEQPCYRAQSARRMPFIDELCVLRDLSIISSAGRLKSLNYSSGGSNLWVSNESLPARPSTRTPGLGNGFAPHQVRLDTRYFKPEEAVLVDINSHTPNKGIGPRAQVNGLAHQGRSQ